MFKRLPVIQTLFSTLAVSMVLTSSALATKPTLIAEEESFNPIAPKSESAPVENSDVIEPQPRRRPIFDNGYQRVIDQTVQMVTNPKAQRLAQRFGLNILNVTWEDTGRYKNSSVGPNISDMTIQVQHRDPKTRSNRLHLMPVIRHPNFSDKTADVRLDRFSSKSAMRKGQNYAKWPSKIF